MKRKSPNYWTLERCKDEALKYDKRIDFIKNCQSAYGACRKNDVAKKSLLNIQRDLILLKITNPVMKHLEETNG